MNENKVLSSFQTLLMTVAAGIAVANIYYNQPILKEIAATFHAMFDIKKPGFGIPEAWF